MTTAESQMTLEQLPPRYSGDHRPGWRRKDDATALSGYGIGDG